MEPTKLSIVTRGAINLDHFSLRLEQAVRPSQQDGAPIVYNISAQYSVFSIGQNSSASGQYTGLARSSSMIQNRALQHEKRE